MQTPSGCVHLGAAGSRRLRRAHFVGWLRGSGSQRTSYFLFNSWTRKGLQSSSDPHFVAGPPSLTPTKIPVPVGLSEKAEGTSGTISRHSSNWSGGWSQASLLLIGDHRSGRKRHADHAWVFVACKFKVKLQLETSKDSQEFPVFSIVTHGCQAKDGPPGWASLCLCPET